MDQTFFFFLFSAALDLNFQNTTLKLEPFCWYVGRWIETERSALDRFGNEAWIFINLQCKGSSVSRTQPHLPPHLQSCHPSLNLVTALKLNYLNPNVLAPVCQGTLHGTPNLPVDTIFSPGKLSGSLRICLSSQGNTSTTKPNCGSQSDTGLNPKSKLWFPKWHWIKSQIQLGMPKLSC